MMTGGRSCGRWGRGCLRKSDLLHDLDHVFVVQHMILANLLGRVLDRGAPHQCVLEVAHDGLVQRIAEVFDGAVAALQHDGGVVVWQLALRFGVDPSEVEVGPHSGEQLVKVPLVVGRDWDGVRHLVDDVKLLDRDLVNLVQHVDHWDVHPVPLDDIDEVVDGEVLGVEPHVGVVAAVLRQHLPDRLQIKVLLLPDRRQIDPALVLPREFELGRLAVDPDPKALELVFNQVLVGEGLHHVEADEDEVAGAGHSNNLPAASLAVLGALDDPGQVEQLDLGPFVDDDPRDRR
mmetsp:Transcript_17299/g.45121  ORF Transcript_17299/g.45121 Transcript_17299/m.45121 type:complete len:290 (-) Transcript_17299:301-1170(-)